MFRNSEDLGTIESRRVMWSLFYIYVFGNLLFFIYLIENVLHEGKGCTCLNIDVLLCLRCSVDLKINMKIRHKLTILYNNECLRAVFKYVVPRTKFHLLYLLICYLKV